MKHVAAYSVLRVHIVNPALYFTLIKQGNQFTIIGTIGEVEYPFSYCDQHLAEEHLGKIVGHYTVKRRYKSSVTALQREINTRLRF